MREIKHLALVARKPLELEIAAPDGVRAGTNFVLCIEQVVRGQLTGCYTVIIQIVA